jgi:hypothetical protein
MKGGGSTVACVKLFMVMCNEIDGLSLIKLGSSLTENLKDEGWNLN